MFLTRLFRKKEQKKVPGHIAFICDGNRRWARARGLPAVAGYKIGAEIVDKTAEYFISRGVNTISYFLFSTENWNRPAAEVEYLMKLLETELGQHADRANEKNIRVKIIGRRDRFSGAVKKLLAKIEKQTAENTAGTIVLALDYGGTDEIVRAANVAIKNGELLGGDDDFNDFTDSGELLPIDLVVRSGREQRISNFMLWKMAYAELLFYPKHWPALNNRDFDKMLCEYDARKRNFGK
ncbi:MAG: di-trans,poly-cis-decaprenylcistransferase [Rickettsiales bacterium]|jgi:undecaprenyl diphosphate synthase|nr:di-trans,poly-cis-decaprenylcistransferase [Rickettsiales bacterium]